jgi:hypothetical protein
LSKQEIGANRSAAHLLMEMLKRESIGVWLDVKPRQKNCGAGIA